MQALLLKEVPQEQSLNQGGLLNLTMQQKVKSAHPHRINSLLRTAAGSYNNRNHKNRLHNNDRDTIPYCVPPAATGFIGFDKHCIAAFPLAAFIIS